MNTTEDNILRRKEHLAARRASLSPEKQVALLLSLQTGTATRPLAPKIPRRPEGEPIPLSFAQERLWIWDQLHPDSIAYNLSQVGRIIGQLNVPAMSQALNEIIRRHESLRTNFIRSGQSAVQVIDSGRVLDLPIVDLGELAEAEWETVARRLAEENRKRPFNLANDPLLRIALIAYKQQHAVLRSMHHIISDLWSGEIFIRELGILYESFCVGDPSLMPELRRQFSDYSYWQRHWLQGEVLESELAYWRKQLDGIQVLKLPTDRPRSPLGSYRAGREVLVLPEELTNQLRILSQQEGATLYILLLAGLKVLLACYTGQEDIAVGTVFAGRNRIETEALIGFFLNTMVMRTKLSSDNSFRDVIASVREVVLGVHVHEEMPFEKLIQELKPDRGPGQTPLFQVMFSMSSTPRTAGENSRGAYLADLSFGSLGGIPPPEIFDDAKFDLTATIAEAPNHIGVAFEYNTALFDRTTVQRMLRHYASLFERMIAEPERRLHQLSLLSEQERHWALIEYNPSVSERWPSHCLTSVFDAQVERTPDAIALDDEHQQVSYKELNKRANQVASYLRGFGVSTESLVGVCMERCANLTVGLLGVLKAGAIYVPLDPALPKERLRFLIEDVGIQVVLTSRRAAGPIPTSAVKIIRLDEDWEAIAPQPACNPASHVEGDNAAYVIFTSGSTGRPKGVVATHAATLNRLEWMWKEHPFEEDVCCQKAMIGFVDSVFEILGPLLKGVRSIVISEEKVKEPAKLIAVLSQKMVTRIVLVQTLLRTLFDSTRNLKDQLPALKLWISSGEYLDRDLAGDFLDLLPRRKLLNSYGSSEVAADAAFFDLALWSGRGDNVPLGPPISNTAIYLLERNKNPCPMGVQGELYVGGAGLARGYLKRPELTAERFVPDHLGNVPGGRLYQTGDLARWLSGGKLDFMGRRDFQVKIRGFRIELGEIEQTLLRHPDLARAAVITSNSLSGDTRLIAFVMPKRRGILSRGELISYLDQRLPDYMVPADLVILKLMPLTASGKIDRLALSRLDTSEAGSRLGYVAPRNVVEARLVEIWENLLGVEPIGVTDSFFSLGGNSMSAIRLAAQIEKHFGQTLSLNMFMEEENIANLANLLSREPEANAVSSLAVLRPGGSRPPFFIVHSIGGEVLEYYKLSRLLGDDQPFYALQSPLGTSPIDADRPIEEVAGSYLKAAREVQPEGPYLLGGYSWGGLVAFEMAQQLSRQNQKVALLAIIDTKPPFDRRVRPWTEDEATYLSSALQGLARVNHDHAFGEAMIELEMLRSGELYKYAVEHLQRWGILDEDMEPETGEAFVRHYIKAYMSRIKAHCNYVGTVYPGRITLFCAQVDPKQAYRWRRLSTEPLRLRELSGAHWDLMKEPHVNLLAEQLRTCIDEAMESFSFVASGNGAG